MTARGDADTIGADSDETDESHVFWHVTVGFLPQQRGEKADLPSARARLADVSGKATRNCLGRKVVGKNTREKEKFSFLKFVRMLKRGINNLIKNKPMVVSFEITDSCNADCRHCNKGGVKREDNLLKPEEYGVITKRLNPLAVQISGGEPLLRRDVVEIVRSIRQLGPLPLIVLVTNGWLLDEAKYMKLKEAGVNYFAVSLDFPDSRHDEWRRMPGLFSRLEKNIPRLASFGRGDIVLNSAITSENLPYLLDLAQTVGHWRASISYSAYSALRTGDRNLIVSSQEDLRVLRQKIGDLVKLKRGKGIILTPAWALKKTYRFFEDGLIADCKAGIRSVVVTPEGHLMPCSMQRVEYSSHEEMVRDFPLTNNCGECYVAIRSLGERTVYNIIEDVVFLATAYMAKGLRKIAK